MVKLEFGKETLIGNIVVDMYASFGLSVRAEDGCFDPQENFINFQSEISYILLEHTAFRIC